MMPPHMFKRNLGRIATVIQRMLEDPLYFYVLHLDQKDISFILFFKSTWLWSVQHVFSFFSQFFLFWTEFLRIQKSWACLRKV